MTDLESEALERGVQERSDFRLVLADENPSRHSAFGKHQPGVYHAILLERGDRGHAERYPADDMKQTGRPTPMRKSSIGWRLLQKAIAEHIAGYSEHRIVH